MASWMSFDIGFARGPRRGQQRRGTGRSRMGFGTAALRVSRTSGRSLRPAGCAAGHERRQIETGAAAGR